VGDEVGNLTVFEVEPGFEDITRSWEMKGTGSPVTSIAIKHGVIVTADVTGKIRVISVEKKALSVEIAAHSRVINAIAVHPTKPIVTAVSEDTYISAWTLPTANQPVVRNILMFAPAPALLTGVTFSGKNSAFFRLHCFA